MAEESENIPTEKVKESNETVAENLTTKMEDENVTGANGKKLLTSKGFTAPVRKSFSPERTKESEIKGCGEREQSSKTKEETRTKKKKGHKPKQKQEGSEERSQQKKVVSIQTLTDAAYEDIFSAVLKKMEIQTENTEKETGDDKEDIKDNFEDLLKVEDNFLDEKFDGLHPDELENGGNFKAADDTGGNACENGDEEENIQPVEVAQVNLDLAPPEIDHYDFTEDLQTPSMSDDNSKCTPKRPAKSSTKKKSDSKKKSAPKKTNGEKTPRKLDFHQEKMTEASSKKEDKTKKRQGKKKKKSRREQFAERKIEETDVWVQCSNTYCLKWRKWLDASNASKIPDNWECHMNTDEKYNSCMTPQQKIEELDDDHEFVFTRYNIGSLVWARMQGFPWWPGILEEDPDTECFYETDGVSRYPTKYHVVFFGSKVSRAWIRADHVEAFTGEEDIGDFGTAKVKGKNYKRELEQAKEECMKAITMAPKERISVYGFSKRYKGSWGKDFTGSQTQSQELVDQKSVNGESPSGSKESSQVLFVHNILSNAESVLNEAEAVLDELEESVNDGDEDFLEVPKKKKKKNNKGKENSEDVGKNMEKSGKRKLKKSGVEEQKPDNVISTEKVSGMIGAKSESQPKAGEKTKGKRGRKKIEKKKPGDEELNVFDSEGVGKKILNGKESGLESKNKKENGEDKKQKKKKKADGMEKANGSKKSKSSFKVPGKVGKMDDELERKPLECNMQEKSDLDSDVFTMELSTAGDDHTTAGKASVDSIPSEDVRSSEQTNTDNIPEKQTSSVSSALTPASAKKEKAAKKVNSKPKFSVKRKKAPEANADAAPREKAPKLDIVVQEDAATKTEVDNSNSDSQNFDLDFDNVCDIPASADEVIDQLSQKIISGDDDSQPFEIEP